MPESFSCHLAALFTRGRRRPFQSKKTSSSTTNNHPHSPCRQKHARSYQTVVPLGIKTQVKVELKYPLDPQDNIDQNSVDIGKTLRSLSHAKHPLAVV